MIAKQTADQHTHGLSADLGFVETFGYFFFFFFWAIADRHSARIAEEEKFHGFMTNEKGMMYVQA